MSPIDFKKGDPYTKVEEGYARLPGAGYEALHPELEGLDPEKYPDIDKMRILADVAPYSREYQKFSQIVRRQGQDDPDLRAEYERIAEQVRQTKESTLQVAKRHFNAPVDKIEGTVKSASAKGIELSEYPGRVFHFSSVGSSMADLTRSLPRSAHKTSSRAGGGAGIPPLMCAFRSDRPLHTCPCLQGRAVHTLGLCSIPGYTDHPACCLYIRMGALLSSQDKSIRRRPMELEIPYCKAGLEGLFPVGHLTHYFRLARPGPQVKVRSRECS